MSSLLNKALSALFRDDTAQANDLFHQFVIQRASEINESLKEGKSYKKGQDEDEAPESKKKKDKERKSESAKKRELSESTEGQVGWWIIDAWDRIVAGPYKNRQDAINASEEFFAETGKSAVDVYGKESNEKILPMKPSIEEGKLELTQGDDGTLHVTHTPEASVEEELPVAAEQQPDDFGAALANIKASLPDEPDYSQMSGDEDLTDDAFESLSESMIDELRTVVVKTKDGELADGSKVKIETRSPIVSHETKDRSSQAKPIKTQAVEHNGFDIEPAPKAEKARK